MESAVPPPQPNASPNDAETLLRVSLLAARAENPREALLAILDIAMETFRATAGSIALINPDTGQLEIEVEKGLPPGTKDVALRPGQGITGWVSFHGRPLLVADVATEKRYVRLHPGVQSEMAAPLIQAGGQIVGVINLDSDRVAAFSPADLARFVRLADEATAVMGRIWQFTHLREKARQLEALIDVGQSLVAKLQPQELYDSITRDTRQVMQTRACALYLQDNGPDRLRCASIAGAVDRPTGDLPLDSCLGGSAIHTRRQTEYANVRSPDFVDLVDLPRDPELHSVLFTPLLFENEPIGVLAVFSGGPHRFNNDEKRLGAALARLATVTVQNARLYARVFQSEASLRKNEQLTTLGLLAAEIAHEIRNPLTVIKLLYGYLGLDFPEGDPRRTDVRLIGEKLDQLEAIVSRVLNFAKAPASLHSRWPIATIIEETLLLIRLKLAQSKIELEYRPPARPLVVDANKGQIQQVLLNLLLNATQAMPDGGRIAVTVESPESAAGFVAVDIADSGHGIPEGIRGRVFDSFLSGRPDGTGLGLAIAKRILLSHHGDISLVSSSPAGTIMRILLPLAKA